MAQEYLDPIPRDVIDKLIEPYWPGALTIVLPCLTKRVPNLVRGGSENLGVRIPNHPTTRAIIRELGKPILGPSANFHGQKTPYELSDLDPDLLRQVEFVVHGSCTVKQASTVINCSVSPWKILRDGAVQLKAF